MIKFGRKVSIRKNNKSNQALHPDWQFADPHCKESPIGSKILSVYAILFAGLLPAVAACIAVLRGLSIYFIFNIIFASVIVFIGIKVFLGESKYLKIFAILVMIHYFGIAFSNIREYDLFPKDSRAFKMAAPRMIRGVLFACFYGWYYLLRKKTREKFKS